MTANGWASPSGGEGGEGGEGDADWHRPANPESGPSRSGPETAGSPSYTGPPATRRPGLAVGWGRLLTPGPVPRSLPAQDHEALDREEASARAVTLGVGVSALVVLLLLLLVIVIRAGIR